MQRGSLMQSSHFMKKTRKYDQQNIFVNSDVDLESEQLRNLLYADGLTHEFSLVEFN